MCLMPGCWNISPGTGPRTPLPRWCSGISSWCIPWPAAGARPAARAGRHPGRVHHSGAQGRAARAQHDFIRLALPRGAATAANAGIARRMAAATTRTGGSNAIHFERTGNRHLDAHRPAARWGDGDAGHAKTTTLWCCVILKTKICAEVGAALGAERGHRPEAREPRAGKAAEIFCEARR